VPTLLAGGWIHSTRYQDTLDAKDAGMLEILQISSVSGDHLFKATSRGE
jgi:hypothetical protein